MPGRPPPPFHALGDPAPVRYPPLDGSAAADVCVVGGGFTGLAAALRLAQSGADVVLVEAGRVGDGGSGRNGGQLHSGQRRDVLWLERRFGFDTAKALWDMAERAKRHVGDLVRRHAIACELRSGLLYALHKPSLLAGERALAEALDRRYGYDRMAVLDCDAASAALGSQRYFGAVRDGGGGHLDPLRLVRGLARAAAAAGARLHEETPALSLGRDGGPRVRTARGDIRAGHVVVATDGRSGGFEAATGRRVLGIASSVLATEPLGAAGAAILPGGECASDSRFAVRYWRKDGDGRLLFGGGETAAPPRDIAATVLPELLEVYPGLKGVRIDHAWSGIVPLTLPRLPFVGEIAPQVWAAAGYSGQGVALAPYVGRLLAERIAGGGEELDLYLRLPVPRLPAAPWLRRLLAALALWQGRLRDRL